MKAASMLCLLLLTSCAKPPNAVRVGTYGVLDSFPFYLALNLGHFRDEGLEVTVEEINAGSKIMEGLVAGHLDVSTDSALIAVLMAAQGRRLKSFFNFYDTNLSVLVVSPSSANRIRYIASLKGAVVGVGSFGSLQHRMLLYYLHRSGLKESDVHLVVIGVAATAAAAIQYGKVDAAVINGASLRLLERQVQGVRVLVDPRSRERAKDLYGVERFPGGWGLLATEKWLSGNPEKASQLVRAQRRTLDWIREHSVEEVLDRTPSHLRSDDRKIDLDHLRTAIGLLSKDGRIPAGGPEAVQRVLAASMDKAMSIDLASTWTNEFLEAQ